MIQISKSKDAGGEEEMKEAIQIWRIELPGSDQRETLILYIKKSDLDVSTRTIWDTTWSHG